VPAEEPCLLPGGFSRTTSTKEIYKRLILKHPLLAGKLLPSKYRARKVLYTHEYKNYFTLGKKYLDIGGMQLSPTEQRFQENPYLKPTAIHRITLSEK